MAKHVEMKVYFLPSVRTATVGGRLPVPMTKNLRPNMPYRTVQFHLHYTCQHMSRNITICDIDRLHFTKCYLLHFKCQEMSANVRKCHTDIFDLTKCHLFNFKCQQMSANVRKCDTDIFDFTKCHLFNFKCQQMSANVRKCDTDIFDLTKCYLQMCTFVRSHLPPNKMLPFQ